MKYPSSPTMDLAMLCLVLLFIAMLASSHTIAIILALFTYAMMFQSFVDVFYKFHLDAGE